MTAPGAQAPVARGALVTVSSTGMRCSVAFQYNPATLQRAFEPQTAGGALDARTQAVRFAAAATQTITVECHLTSLHGRHPAGPSEQGVVPQLAALEMLLYPSTAQVETARDLLEQGAVQILPPLADTALFVWGQNVLPVRLTAASVLEEMFDASLVPIQATVSLTMRVLTYSDVDPANLAFQQFLGWQQSMEDAAKPATTYAGNAS